MIFLKKNILNPFVLLELRLPDVLRLGHPVLVLLFLEAAVPQPAVQPRHLQHKLGLEARLQDVHAQDVEQGDVQADLVHLAVWLWWLW